MADAYGKDDLTQGAEPSVSWVHRVRYLVNKALGGLVDATDPTRHTLMEAASLLRTQGDRGSHAVSVDARGGLLAWQARKIRDYIDAHIAESLTVAELCALIQRSDAHFSRSFRRTFGESPHAFVIRRRLKWAAQYMLQTDASLSEIALRCGFTDHAHLCKHFRRLTGTTPASWRRARQASAARHALETDAVVRTRSDSDAGKSATGLSPWPQMSPGSVS
jgi:AraC family transcriptional regulator